MRIDNGLEFQVLLRDQSNALRDSYNLFDNREFEKIIPFDEDFGSGEMRTISVTKDIGILTTKLRPRANILYEAVIQSGKINLTYVLEGAPVSFYVDDHKKEMIEGGENFLISPATYTAAELVKDKAIHAFTLRFKPDLIWDYLGDREQSQQSGLSQVLSRIDSSSFIDKDLNEPEMRAIIVQMLHCPFHGGVQQLYLEGKSMELIALRMNQLVMKDFVGERAQALSKEDIDKMFYVRDLLLRNLATPPSLSELAISALINTNKLKIYFKQVFGETVFGYLRAKRLEYARSLLLEGGKNISEIASVAGYWDISAFNKAFRQKYGMSPGQYKSNSRL